MGKHHYWWLVVAPEAIGASEMEGCKGLADSRG